MDYWDTSALVKLYAREPDSEQFAEFQQTATEPVYASALADIEVLCALHRKERSKDIAYGSALRLYEKFLSDCAIGRIVHVPYGEDVASRTEEIVRAAFQRSKPVLIRSLDVIHVASALAIRAKRIVATDSRLREVASLNSLALLP
jgi:predicted nucleic acid-binding protein